MFAVLDLLRQLTSRLPALDDREATSIWARSGAMPLSGRPDGPALVAPASVLDVVRAAEAVIDEQWIPNHSGRSFDGAALLGERAAIAGLSRQGDTSCGGGSSIIRGVDGWIALSLARGDDVDLLAAWLAPHRLDAIDATPLDLAGLRTIIADLPVADLVDRAVLLGLPCSRLGETTADATAVDARLVSVAPTRSIAGAVVIDLSSLWAGPLAGNILTGLGARVIKVESTSRRDGARSGPAAFFDLLHGGQESFAVDLRERDGRGLLRDLIGHADVVIEASRPRALDQMGIDRDALMTSNPIGAWLSITGHGRKGPNADRVAFGDDAAVAGGLVTWDTDGPCFCADAIADPLSGMVGAASVIDRLAAGGRWTLDLSMSGVSAVAAERAAAAATAAAAVEVDVGQPRARRALSPAPALGSHTAALIAEFDLGGRSP